MKKYLLMLILLPILNNEASSIFQCKSPSGEIFFQGKPCKSKSETVSTRKIKVKVDYSKLSDWEEFLLNSYLLSVESEVLLKECVKRNIKVSDNLSRNLKRYNEIAQYNIDDGKKLYYRGARQDNSLIIRKYLAQEKERIVSEMTSANQIKAEKICQERSAFLPKAAANTPNRASDYKQGDLDPDDLD